MSIIKLGFAGLGVMGEPICRNIMEKSGLSMQVFDLSAAAIERLQAKGATVAATIGELASGVDVLFLSLPGGPQLEQVVTQDDGVLAHGKDGLILVDMSTAPVGLTRSLAEKLAEKGISYADAPVARTRQAAEEGTLSIMVGASNDIHNKIHPLLSHAASDVTHCGDIGCGQIAKILNNMVLFQTVVALSEAKGLAETAGMDPALLFDVLSKGSADSFALRNHGQKAMIPGVFPKGAFSTDYAAKDVSYAIELANELGIETPGAILAQDRLHNSSKAGYPDEYFPVMSKLVKPN